MHIEIFRVEYIKMHSMFLVCELTSDICEPYSFHSSPLSCYWTMSSNYHLPSTNRAAWTWVCADAYINCSWALSQMMLSAATGFAQAERIKKFRLKLLMFGSSFTNIVPTPVMRVWVITSYHNFLWIVITHPCPMFCSRLINQSVKVGHWWEIIAIVFF